MCPTCELAWRSPRVGEGFIELSASAPAYPNSYLMQCPRCRAFWMGHGCTPQYMMELTPAEAREIFPDLQQSGPAA